MKLLTAPRQPFVGLALVAAVGIISADFIPISSTVRVVILGITMGAVLVSLVRPCLIVTYSIVGLCFFLLHDCRTTSTVGQKLAAELGEEPRAVTVIGVVVSEPKVSSSKFASFLFKLESIELEDTVRPTTATLFVRWRGKPEFGDKMKFFGMAEPIAPPRNPGEFDLRRYLERSDVRRSVFVRDEANGILLRHGQGNAILKAAQESRNWLQGVLCRGLNDSPEVQSFISGISLGLRRQTPEDIEEPFQQTGTLHLFAVAGLHVGIFAELLWILAMVVRLSHKQAAGLIIPALFFYAAITGLHVSSVRAAIMSAILLGGIFFERRVFLLNSLAAAAFFLLCWDTNELFSAGFQLSFSVVGAIVLLADPIFGSLRRWNRADPFLPRTLLRGWRNVGQICFEWICRGASVSAAAWIGSLVLILWYFYLVTPISLIANLVVVPIAFFILAIALLSIIAAPLLTSLSIIFNNANWALAQFVFGIVHLCAQLPGGHIYLKHPHLPQRLVAAGTVLDVGAGAAVHLQARDSDWLFDCGSERNYQRLVRQYLHSAGVNRLRGLLLTHGDSLHIGGTRPLLIDLPPEHVIDNATSDRSRIHKRLREGFRNHGIHPSDLTLGDTFHVSRDVTAQILYPPRVVAATKADDQTYVVRLLVDKTASILLMSDSGEATERALLVSGSALRSDILIKGQHYSGRSSSDEFLNAVQPKLIVSTARDFPEHERISDAWAINVQARGIKLFRQDQTGAVMFRFARGSWEAQSYLTGETFRSPSR